MSCVKVKAGMVMKAFASEVGSDLEVSDQYVSPNNAGWRFCHRWLTLLLHEVSLLEGTLITSIFLTKQIFLRADKSLTGEADARWIGVAHASAVTSLFVSKLSIRLRRAPE